jgi:hypothetical protein
MKERGSLLSHHGRAMASLFLLRARMDHGCIFLLLFPWTGTLPACPHSLTLYFCCVMRSRFQMISCRPSASQSGQYLSRPAQGIGSIDVHGSTDDIWCKTDSMRVSRELLLLSILWWSSHDYACVDVGCCPNHTPKRVLDARAATDRITQQGYHSFVVKNREVYKQTTEG